MIDWSVSVKNSNKVLLRMVCSVLLCVVVELCSFYIVVFSFFLILSCEEFRTDLICVFFVFYMYIVPCVKTLTHLANVETNIVVTTELMYAKALEYF